MMNLVIAETDGLVVELQLNLFEFTKLKKEEHRLYNMFRAVGWDVNEKRQKQEQSIRRIRKRTFMPPGIKQQDSEAAFQTSETTDKV